MNKKNLVVNNSFNALYIKLIANAVLPTEGRAAKIIN